MNTVDLGEVAHFDHKRIVNEIMEVRGRENFLIRARHDWLGEEIQREVELYHAIDETAISTYVKDLAKSYDSKPKNAKRSVKGYDIVIKADVSGRKIEIKQTEERMMSCAQTAAETGKTSSVIVPYKELKAKTTAAKLAKKTGLVVSLSKRRIYLYKGDKLVKSYPCAIGTPSHPTPKGDFKIVAKRSAPTWTNPGSAWASSMPDSIPPGPSNPLGLRALNLNAPGIRIHGTTNIGSLGTPASHGCMRVANAQIVDLFSRVSTGDPVYVKQ
jgi:lipoprotein-anchoring transpeptidase ErfK/SrfK